MRKFIKLFTTMLAVFVLATLASCKKDPAPAPVTPPTKYTAQEMAEAVVFDYDKKDVTFQISLNKTVERQLEGSEEVQTETVTWTTQDNRIVIDGYYCSFNFDETKKDTPAVITANVQIGEEKGSVDFQVRVAKESNYDEYMALNKGENVAISGYVYQKGEFSPDSKKPDKNPGNASLILVDKTGQHFFYAHLASMKKSLYENLKPGQYVGLTGTKDIYNHCHQIGVGANVERVEGEDKVVNPTPLEFTQANLDTKDWVKDNSYAPAKATLFVTATPEDYKNQQRKAEVKVRVADQKGKDVYLCNYDYFFNFDKDKPENNSQELKDIHGKLMELLPGDTVEVEGFFAAYKGTTAFYVNEVAKLNTVSRNADYAAVGLEQTRLLDVLKGVLTDTADTYDLTPTAGITAEYTLSDTTQQVVKLEGNSLVVTPTKKKTEVTLTIKITKGAEVRTFEHKLTIQIPGSKFEEYMSSATGDVIQNITGVITYVNFRAGKTNYATVTLQDANGAYYIRQAVVDEAEMNTLFKVGHELTITQATVELYAGIAQLSSADKAVYVLGAEAKLPEVKTLTEEMIADNNLLKPLVSQMFTVTGKARVVVGPKYTNIYLKVGAQEIEIRADKNITSDKLTITEGQVVTAKGLLTPSKNDLSVFRINVLSANDVVVVTPAPTPAA